MKLMESAFWRLGNFIFMLPSFLFLGWVNYVFFSARFWTLPAVYALGGAVLVLASWWAIVKSVRLIFEPWSQTPGDTG
jgi:hypothetical protein